MLVVNRGLLHLFASKIMILHVKNALNLNDVSRNS